MILKGPTARRVREALEVHHVPFSYFVALLPCGARLTADPILCRDQTLPYRVERIAAPQQGVRP